MAEIKFCPKCGKERFDNSVKVCESCGFEFEKQDSSKGLIIALIIIAVLVMSFPILAIVAALTIPSLVNRQQNLTAQVKIRKSIASYETMTGAYMAEYEKKSFANALTPNCDNANKYFKFVTQDRCNFEMADGSYWEFDPYTGNATIKDNKTKPTYGVVVWTADGLVNSMKSYPKGYKFKFHGDSPQCVYSAGEFLNKTSHELNECTYKK